MKKLVRYIYLLPIVTTIIFGLMFFNMIEIGENALFENTKIERYANVDIVADQLDMLILLEEDWEAEYNRYEETLLFTGEVLDAQPYTFAATYNSELELVSARYDSDDGDYPIVIRYMQNFVEEVKNNERGEMVLQIHDEGIEELYIHYRWVPTDNTLEGRFLLVVGVWKSSSMVSYSSGLSVWVSVLLVLNALLNFLMVWVIKNKSGGRL